MTPPAAATAAARSDERRLRRSAAGAPPRRVSGPPADRRDARAASRARLQAVPAPARTGPGRPHRPVVATGAAQALPGRRARADARPASHAGDVVDRLLRSRAWIGLVAGLLIGLVFLQVTLLKVNAGIGDTVDQANRVERANDALRAEISTLVQGERITTAAAKQLGMVFPQPNEVRYLEGTRAGGVGGTGGLAGSGAVDADGNPVDSGATDGTAATDPTGSTGSDTTDTSGASDTGDGSGAAPVPTGTDAGTNDTRVGAADSTGTSGAADSTGTSGAADSTGTSGDTGATETSGDATTGGAAAPAG